MLDRKRDRARTKKFQRQKSALVEAGSRILNQRGLKGLTLSSVTQELGMHATGAAYYFTSKEKLTAACFLRSIDMFEQLIAEAMQRRSFDERLGCLIHGYFKSMQDVAEGKAREFAILEDLRALNSKEVGTAHEKMFRSLRRLFDPLITHPIERSALNARAHLLLWQLMHCHYWLDQYEPHEYVRIADRMIDILLRGLRVDAARWQPVRDAVPAYQDSDDLDPREPFLRAATQLMTLQGNIDVSVERISKQLDLSKGAFYYHMDAKTDLVEICYKRTFDEIRHAQRSLCARPMDGFNRLASMLLALTGNHIRGSNRLLRVMMPSLPDGLKLYLSHEIQRTAVQLGTLVSDAIIDGSMRKVDSQIAGQMLLWSINAITELARWAPSNNPNRLAEYFIRPLFESLETTSFDPGD